MTSPRLSNMAGDGLLKNIQQEAIKLFQVVLSCPVGAQRAVYDPRGGGSYPKFVAVKKREKELFAKCVEVEAEVNLLKGDKHTFNAVEDRSERIQQLQMEIADIKAKHHQDTLLLDLLQKSQCTSKIIFSQNHSELDSFDDLKSVLQQQSEVVTELIRNLKEVENSRNKIEDIRTQRSALQVECRKLMSHLQQESKQRLSHEEKTQAVQEMQEKLKEVTSQAVLLQHTLQALIGGYINWAADEEMQEVLLSLGTPL